MVTYQLVICRCSLSLPVRWTWTGWPVIYYCCYVFWSLRLWSGLVFVVALPCNFITSLLYHVIELTLSGVLAHSSAWQGGECNMFKTVLFCFQPVTDSLQSLFVVVAKSIYTHILGKMLFFCLFHVYSLMFFICCSWILFSITCHFVFFYSFSFVSWNQEDSLLMGCSAF